MSQAAGLAAGIGRDRSERKHDEHARSGMHSANYQRKGTRKGKHSSKDAYAASRDYDRMADSRAASRAAVLMGAGHDQNDESSD